MSGRPEPPQGPSEEARGSSSIQALIQGHEARGACWSTRSWKIVLSVVFILTFLLIACDCFDGGRIFPAPYADAQGPDGLSKRFRSYVWLKEGESSQKPRRFHAAIAEYGSRLSSYQARLRMPKEHLELIRKESQTLENNYREILLLIEQIDVLKALLRDTQAGLHSYNDSWDAAGDPAEAQEHAEAVGQTSKPTAIQKWPSLKEMSNLVNYVLKKLREDQVQMADYALKSAGASIIEAGTSESYKSDTAKLYWHGIGFLNYEMPPDSILQPDVHPGKCWAFPGSQGHALIKLAGKIIPTAVTMEHISEKVSPSGSISSAPKEFSVHGISSECEGEEASLGQFVYNKTGATVQTFELQHEVSEPILCVKLKILSNWGHPKYTCLYRFRVHGSPEDHS